jgi:ribosomal protein S18 acetylase RimI-like enzyme
MNIEPATKDDAREIMTWFPDKESVMRWGSPYTRYPLREETFFVDVEWDSIPAFVARNDDGDLLAFGQFYNKLGRCHLARLAVAPEYRGRGLGEEFVAALMARGARELGADEFSLYVMTANKPAYNCYRALGFHVAPPPLGDAQLENCVFMTSRQLPD